MRTYTLTADEHDRWYDPRPAVRESVWNDVRRKVVSLAIQHDEMHEVVDRDGNVVDPVVYPSSINP